LVFGVLQLSNKWGPLLTSQPETGMGYQIASIVLKDGRKYDQAVITGGIVTKIRNTEDIPFREDDIDQIIVTHAKWNFDEGSLSSIQ
jgi:hypothetical protein